MRAILLLILTLLSSILIVHPSTVTAATWSSPVAITSGSILHFSPSSTQDGKGTVYLFWDQNPGINYITTNTSNIARGYWPSSTLYTVDSTHFDYNPSAIALKNGTILMFYASQRAGSWAIYAARYNNGLWSPETRFTNGLTPDQNPIAIQDSGGKIWLAWTRTETGDINLRFADSNANGAWDPGEAIVYDSNGNGIYDNGEPVIYGSAPLVGTSLLIDQRIKFIDSNNNGVWNSGEFVLFDPNLTGVFDPKIKYADLNNNNVWDAGEPVLYDSNSDGVYVSHVGIGNCLGTSLTQDCVIAGKAPGNQTLIKTDPSLKFADTNVDNAWEPGEALVSDRNNNGVYDTGEPAVTPVFNDPKLRFVGSGSTWVGGNSVVYDSNGNGLFDSKVKFVDSNHNGHWDQGETVLYDANMNSFYDLSDTPIFEANPGTDLGKPLTNDPSLRFLDSNGDGTWEPGEAVVYDSNNNGVYDGSMRFADANSNSAWDPGEAVVYDTNRNGQYDPKIRFVDSNTNNIWNQGETVVYDTNNNGQYNTGKYNNDTIIAGTPPANNTVLKVDSKIKFADSDKNNTWTAGEIVVYDSNNNGAYDTGEPVIAGSTPTLGTPIESDEPLISGVAPVPGAALKIDPKIKFYDNTGSTQYHAGESVIYDSDNNNVYGNTDSIIAGPTPPLGTGLSTGLGEPVISYGSPSSGTSLKTDTKVKYVESDRNNVWDPGEDVFYDVNNTGTYNPADPVIFSNGTLPSPGVPLRSDPKLEYADNNGNNMWDSGEAVVDDTNLNHTYDTGEYVVAGTIPASGSTLSIDGEPVIAGPTPATLTSLKTDPKIRFADPNANRHWDPGEAVVYDNNDNTAFDTGDIIITGTPSPVQGTRLITEDYTIAGITLSANSNLRYDPNVKFVDTNGNMVWDQGETVVYDSNNDLKYNFGKFHNDTIISGPAPANNTSIRPDPLIKYSESDGNTMWENGESVVYDRNNDNFFGSSDSIIAVFQIPSLSSHLVSDSKLKYFETATDTHWDFGEPVLYDANANGLYEVNETTIAGTDPSPGTSLSTDSNIKFIDSNGNGHWDPGEAVVYDSNGNGFYNVGEYPIVSGPPEGGSLLKTVSHIFYNMHNGSSWSLDRRLTTQPSNDNSPSLGQTVDGRVWITWSGVRGAVPGEILFRTTLDGTSWTSESLLASTQLGDKDPSMVQDRNGTIWVTWSRDLSCSCGQGVTFQYDLYYIYSNDNGATWIPATPFMTTKGTNEVEPAMAQFADKNLYVFDSAVVCGSGTCTSNLNYMNSLIGMHSARMNGLTVQTTNLRIGQTLRFTANVSNTGDFNDTFVVTIMADGNPVATNSSLVLSGRTVQIRVNWVAAGINPGNHTLTATVADPGESLANKFDNNGSIPGTVLIRPAGDVNGDCLVNIVDLVMVASAFGKTLGSPGYNPAVDLNNDGVINVVDLSTVGATFGQRC